MALNNDLMNKSPQMMIMGENGESIVVLPKPALPPKRALPTTPPPTPVNMWVKSRSGDRYIAIYQDYNNTKIKNPSVLIDGSKIQVYESNYGNGFKKIVGGSYDGWYIQGSFLSSSAPPIPDPPPEIETKNSGGNDAGEGDVGGSGTDTSSATNVSGSGNTSPSPKNDNYSFKNTLEMEAPVTGNEINESYSEALAGFRNAFGSPFLYSNDTDPCYYRTSDNYNTKNGGAVGHTMMSTMYSTPAVFSICPGKVTYLPNLLSNDGSSLFQKLSAKFKDVTTDVIGLDEESGTSGAFAKQLYAFSPDYNDYINRLNVMARVSAIFMGIGDKKCPWQPNVAYRNADYSYFTTGKRGSNENNHSGLDEFLWQLDTAMSDLDSTDLTYIHFFLTQDGSAVEQDFTVNADKIGLFEKLNGSDMQETVKEISFLFNGAMSSSDTWNTIEADLDSLTKNIAGSHENAASLLKMVKGWAQGGKMIIPDMISDVGYNSSVTCRLNFRSLYGDPESVFLNVNLPCLALLCFVLPKQLAENMYGYPYICRCFQRGFYNSDLCIMANLNFVRGGDSESSWTASGLATEVEASFTITPLYAALAGGNGRNPFLFMSNTALIEYLGNMCGLDLKVDQVDLKWALVENLLGPNYYQDIFGTLGRKTSDYMRGKLDKLFNFN